MVAAFLVQPNARNVQGLPLARVMPPLEPVGLARRERLESLAGEVLRSQVTLVSGPGGYGKTTLLLAWHRLLESRARCAWLTLTLEESSLSAVAEGFALAFDRAFAGSAVWGRALPERADAEARAYAAVLANQLYVATEDSGEEAVLFVDDLHTIIGDPQASRYVSTLLQGLPRRVHVVIASRHTIDIAPIAKLRNARRLLEVTAADLRFRPEEALLLLRDRSVARSVVERTGGWAIAVQSIAALEHAGRSAAPERLPQVSDAIFAFLAQEVMTALERDLRDLLRPLAIPQTFDAQTLDYLLERADGAAIITRLLNHSLYVERADDGLWRFHQLFRDFLLKNLRENDPEREREVRRRYARWLRDRGEKLAALQQLIETGDLSEIVEYAQEALVTIRFTDRYRRLLGVLARVPQDVKQRKPVLYRLHANALQRAGHWREADVQLEACYEAAIRTGDAGEACMALIHRGIAAGNFQFRLHGTHEDSHRSFSRALELAESPALADRPAYRKVAFEVLGLTEALRYNYENALELLGRAEQLELAEHSHVELVFVEIARVYGWTGDWRKSLEYADLAEELFRQHAPPGYLGYALIVQAKALIMLGEEPDRAIAVSREAVESLRGSFEDEELGAAYAVHAEALLAAPQPDLQAVADACARAEEFLDLRNAAGRFEVALCRARAALFSGDGLRAADAIRGARRFFAQDTLLSARAILHESVVAFECGEDAMAADFARRSGGMFASCQDRFCRALASLVASGAESRMQTLTAERAQQVLRLVFEDAPYAVRHARSAAVHLLLFALRRGVEPKIVEALSTAAQVTFDMSDLAEIAEDAEMIPDSRLVALRLLTLCSTPAEHAQLLHALAGCEEPRVAAQAAEIAAKMQSERALPLELHVVAGLHARIGEEAVNAADPRWGRRKAPELLRLLAVSGTPISKAAAIAALWPDAEKGREVTLRVTIHALRRALQPNTQGSSDYITFDGNMIALRRSEVRFVDAEQALLLADRGKHFASLARLPEAEDALAQAAKLLLPAQKEADAPPWLGPHLRRWRAAAIEALRVLARVYHAHHRADEALATIRQALALDSFDEETVLLALDVFAAAGAVDEGRALYASYKRRLADVLGTVPGNEITQCYSRLLQQRKETRRSDLSARELQILRSVASGQTSKDIGAKLGLSVFTVNNHVGRILKKLGVESRAAAVAQLRRLEGKP